MGKTISTILEKKSSSALSLRLKMEKCVESLQKQTMGVTFNPQKSQLFTFSLPTEEIFWGTVANLSVVDFRAQTREMP